MKEEELDQKFQEGLDLWVAGKVQEGAEIWMELAEHGHLVSIRELFHIFLDQKEFEAAESYIEYAKDPNEPTILYLKARLIEERDGVDAAVGSFDAAADAGHPGANSLMFRWAVEARDLASAKYYFEILKGFEKDLSEMRGAETLNELQEQVEGLHRNLLEILPVYFVLASGRWMRVRSEINEREEDQETWEAFLAENNLTVEEFERYEQWWIFDGAAVVAKLKAQFIEDLLEATSPDFVDTFEDYLSNYANWDDFIRELSDCTPADTQSIGGGQSYFSEYAIENGLCDPVVSAPEFDDEMIAKIAEQVESWFRDNHARAQTILLSAYDDIMEIRKTP
jgi:hypothetical protein